MTIKQLCTFTSAVLAASAGAAEAPIQSVTLYPGSATIERVLQVAPGATQVEITGLLANFSTDTIRLQADPGITVGQVLTRDQAGADNPSPRAADLEAKIEALQDQVALIDADYQSAKLVRSYLEKLGSGENTTAVDAKSLGGALDAIQKGGSDALGRMHRAEVKKRALDKQIEALKRELAKVQAGAEQARVMTVFLSVRQPGKVVLSYQVNRAGWKPTYRASLDSKASTVELERLATISQKTGEDWSNVKLRLSTGQPSTVVYAPEPSAWLLTYRPPAPEVREQFAMAAPPAPAMAMATGSRRVAADDYSAPVLETQGSFATEYDVPARVNLAADGREISVGLARQSLPARQRVRIAPRTSNDVAVLTAESSRPEGVWLPGQVQLNRDGSYVGALHWNPGAQERFLFSFGRDPLMRVVVEHGNDKSGQAGFFNREQQRRVDDAYAVTSLHRQPIDILVLEPTPVSQSDKVTVKATLSPEPSVKDWEQRRGLVGWEKTLQPNETARFKASYVIDYPKEGYVSGLP
ncbi:MAG: mucoidy inhibitor MuiA family protein [Gammaproteobacteria bacterium]